MLRCLRSSSLIKDLHNKNIIAGGMAALMCPVRIIMYRDIYQALGSQLYIFVMPQTAIESITKTRGPRLCPY